MNGEYTPEEAAADPKKFMPWVVTKMAVMDERTKTTKDSLGRLQNTLVGVLITVVLGGLAYVAVRAVESAQAGL